MLRDSVLHVQSKSFCFIIVALVTSLEPMEHSPATSESAPTPSPTETVVKMSHAQFQEYWVQCVACERTSVEDRFAIFEFQTQTGSRVDPQAPVMLETRGLQSQFQIIGIVSNSRFFSPPRLGRMKRAIPDRDYFSY